MPAPNSDMSDLTDFMFSYDLNYYHNYDYLPNQELVFQTVEYFEQGDGKEFCKPLDFLNLMYWHYKFIGENLDKPYDIIKQIDELVATDAGKHVLIAFLIKWYGGYPIKNLNPKYTTVLKLLEKKYLRTLKAVHEERQLEANKGLGGVGYDLEKMKELEKEADFVGKLDKLVKNASEKSDQKPATPEPLEDSTIALKNDIDVLKKENKDLNASLTQTSAVVWFKNYGMWFTIIGAAFLLGFYFGNNKFDSEKLRLNELVGKQSKSIDSLKSIKTAPKK